MSDDDEWYEPTADDFACRELYELEPSDSETPLDAIQKHIDACSTCRAADTRVTVDGVGTTELRFKLLKEQS